eukprot:gene37199-45153_t
MSFSSVSDRSRDSNSQARQDNRQRRMPNNNGSRNNRNNNRSYNRGGGGGGGGRHPQHPYPHPPVTYSHAPMYYVPGTPFEPRPLFETSDTNVNLDASSPYFMELTGADSFITTCTTHRLRQMYGALLPEDEVWQYLRVLGTTHENYLHLQRRNLEDFHRDMRNSSAATAIAANETTSALDNPSSSNTKSSGRPSQVASEGADAGTENGSLEGHGWEKGPTGSADEEGDSDSDDGDTRCRSTITDTAVTVASS